MDREALQKKLESAVSARAELIDERHESAFRLFNGFYEGEPELLLDIYARTLVIYNYADPPADGLPAVEAARIFQRSSLPWLRTVILKTRNSSNPNERRGLLIEGEAPDTKIREHGIWLMRQ